MLSLRFLKALCTYQTQHLNGDHICLTHKNKISLLLLDVLVYVVAVPTSVLLKASVQPVTCHISVVFFIKVLDP